MRGYSVQSPSSHDRRPRRRLRSRQRRRRRLRFQTTHCVLAASHLAILPPSCPLQRRSLRERHFHGLGIRSLPDQDDGARQARGAEKSGANHVSGGSAISAKEHLGRATMSASAPAPQCSVVSAGTFHKTPVSFPPGDHQRNSAASLLGYFRLGFRSGSQRVAGASWSSPVQKGISGTPLRSGWRIKCGLRGWAGGALSAVAVDCSANRLDQAKHLRRC